MYTLNTYTFIEIVNDVYIQVTNNSSLYTVIWSGLN